MDSDDGGNTQERWARLRFAVVGPLLASPPPSGQLRAELERRLFPPPPCVPRPQPDWVAVHREMKFKSMTLLVLWDE